MNLFDDGIYKTIQLFSWLMLYDYRDSTRHTLSSWTRLVGQTCRIPNHLEHMIPGGRRGCYVLKFSHDGRLE